VLVTVVVVVVFLVFLVSAVTVHAANTLLPSRASFTALAFAANLLF